MSTLSELPETPAAGGEEHVVPNPQSHRTPESGSVPLGRELLAVPAPASRVREPFGHRAEIDGLRGLAVLCVIAYHSGLLEGGWLGVDIFFALSGFLITSLILEEHANSGAVSLRYFYARRALRLLPALLTLVLVLSIVLLVTTTREYRGYLQLYVLAVLFYFANWIEPWGTPLGWGFGHTWSLAIEEQFYLVWPLALIALLRFVRRRAMILTIVMGAIAAAFAYRIVLTRAGASAIRLFEGSDTHADPLLIGCALALLRSSDMLPRERTPRMVLSCLAGLSTLGLAALLLRARLPLDYVEHAASTLAAICTSVIVADLVGPRSLLRRPLRSGLLVGTGRVSYGLYLWHYPIFFALGIQTYGAISAGWTIATAWGGTVGAALVSFFVIERPALRWKTRFTPGGKHVEAARDDPEPSASASAGSPSPDLGSSGRAVWG